MSIVPSPDAMRRIQVAIREALARMDEAWGIADLDHFYNATVEAAMWFAAVDEHLRSDRGYRGRRDVEVGGRIVLAMHVVRNAALHNLVDIHDSRFKRTATALVVPSTVVSVVRGATWRHRSSLDGKVDAKEAALKAYDDLLAGRDVQRTLPQAQGFIWMRAIPTGLGR